MKEAEVNYPTYPFEKVECVLKEPDYSNMYFEFRFKDGETAKYRMDKECQTMQQFFDRVNTFHELEKENTRLQEQVADANKTIDYYDKKDFHYTLADGTVMGAEPAHKYKLKWGVK